MSRGVTFCGRRSTWCRSSVTFRGRCSTWWSSSVTFPGRCSTWWSSSVTFRGRRSTSWSASVTFRGRRSTWWRFECKIGRETLYCSIENARGEFEKWPHLRGGLRTVGFMVGLFSDHGRIMVGSFSDRPRIGNDVSPVFGHFLWNFAMQFCVAGAVFGEVGSWHLLLRAL